MKDDKQLSEFRQAVEDVLMAEGEAELRALLEQRPPRQPDPRGQWHMETDAAKLLGLTKKALESRRARGTAPRFDVKKFGFVIYYDADLDEWVRSKPKGFRPPPDWFD